MKPTDPVSLLNIEAMTKTTEAENETIKKRMEEAWRKNYKLRN